VRLSGRGLLPVLRRDWMARVVTHCVVLSAVDKHLMVICYFYDPCVLATELWVVPCVQTLRRGTCAAGVVRRGSNG
jgi:hypothetical protein